VHHQPDLTSCSSPDEIHLAKRTQSQLARHIIYQDAGASYMPAQQNNSGASRTPVEYIPDLRILHVMYMIKP
jgi:hypothetical protein